jgi:hypothetical protein
MEQKLDKLSYDFFKLFSRFEYSLKATGFHSGEGDAKPDWRKFAESVSGIFENPKNNELREAIQYISNNPPKKQVIKQGLLEWSQANPTAALKSDLMLSYVRRVRNNLFHGGKFNGHWFAPERSEPLIRHSLVILNACLKASPKVWGAYNDPTFRI